MRELLAHVAERLMEFEVEQRTGAEYGERTAERSNSRNGYHGTLKTELVNPVWLTREAARAAVFNYIEAWYNPRRRHSALGYISPNQYESLLPIAA